MIAKIYPGESFSEVVLRASCPEYTVTAEELVTMCRERGPTFGLDELDRIDDLKEREEPPEDKWAKRSNVAQQRTTDRFKKIQLQRW